MPPHDPPIGWTSLDLLERVRQGDAHAEEAIFARYFERLTLLARRRLSTRLLRRVDPEDIVLSAYRSFFMAARDGRFVLGRGGDLWNLLASITRHKLLRQARRQRAERRTIDREVGLRAADETAAASAHQPRPEAVAALADELDWLLARLSPFGQTVLELRLQGTDLAAIATATGRSERTVRRLMGEIRHLMEMRFGDD